MPKAKANQIITYRIELQDKEREVLESYLAAYSLGRAGELLQGLGIPEIAKSMKDPIQMIQVFYSIAMVIEFMGFETGLPTPADFGDWYNEKQSKLGAMKADREAAGGGVSVAEQFLDTIRTILGVDPSRRWEDNGVFGGVN